MHAFVNVFDCNSKKQGPYIVAATLVWRIVAMEFVVCNVFVCSSCRASPPPPCKQTLYLSIHIATANIMTAKQQQSRNIVIRYFWVIAEEILAVVGVVV